MEVEQARPPAIMWVSKPMTRPDRRACLPIIPIPAAAHAVAPPRWPPTSAAACLTTSPSSPTLDSGVADGMRCARCWPWRLRGTGGREVVGRDRRVGRGCARPGAGRARRTPRPVDRCLQATCRGDGWSRAGPRRSCCAGPGPAHHPPGAAPCRPPLAHRDGVCGHQPHRRSGKPRPPGRLRARPLGHPGAAPHPRCHLRRGRLEGPHRHRPAGHGQPAQPLAIGILRRHGHRNTAAALRSYPRHTTRILPLLGITSP
jgi:hypothetical protein